MMDGAFAGKLPWGELFVVSGKKCSFGSLMGLLIWETLWMPGEVGIDEEDK
ncbi:MULTISPECIES: hypothetical protein [Paenibacillus]|uniref:hypothetical protein n=1 Tax=Paenibacillus TaxID=44249 RepID=UPI0016424A18|nr:hypothetical protein [Paenibacillus sp. IHBB 10380]